jgi:CRISPR/Cas system-associated protein Cas10 (large subunit of type III CRISPR-Cas system)
LTEDLQQEADRRFATRLEETGARDPRDFYRELLKQLKTRNEESYGKAVARFRDEVVGPIARDDRDPLEAWVGYGLSLARELHPGRTVVLDRAGRSVPFEPPPDPDSMILQLPDEKRDRAVPVNLPTDPSPAQRAAMDLLVEGKVKLSDR